MRRTDKKIDNNVRKALTLACDTALESVDGFKWLTHTASYDCFPGSLSVVCIFDSNELLDKAREQDVETYFRRLIQGNLLKVGIKFKNVQKQIRFDTEENCDLENEGNWKERIANYKPL